MGSNVQGCYGLAKRVPSFRRPSRPISLEAIRSATSSFSYPTCGLHRGHSSTVFRANIDGQEVAIKKFNTCDRGSALYLLFETEGSILSGLDHERVLKMKGYCIEGHNRILVLEFMPGRCLFGSLLFDSHLLVWEDRIQIAIDIADALLYLHSARILHCDISAHNVLIDGEKRAKLSGFSSSVRLAEGLNHFYDGTIRGTAGYIDPGTVGYYNISSDIYAFGVLLLQLVIGTTNPGHVLHGGEILGTYVTQAVVEQGRTISSMRSSALVGFTESSLERMGELALQCVHPVGPRPQMGAIRDALIANQLAFLNGE